MYFRLQSSPPLYSAQVSRTNCTDLGWNEGWANMGSYFTNFSSGIWRQCVQEPKGNTEYISLNYASKKICDLGIFLFDRWIFPTCQSNPMWDTQLKWELFKYKIKLFQMCRTFFIILEERGPRLDSKPNFYRFLFNSLPYNCT